MSLPVPISSDVESETCSEVVGVSTGRTSPTPSVYSYSSSVDRHTMLRDLHGRTLNATTDRYMLPADSTEHGRLDLQHELLRRQLGGLFLRPDAVRRALAPRQDVPPAVLDVGTGSGSWAIDMGRHFPHVEVTGLDLAPANLSTEPPPNCRFECDDVNLGLNHYRNAFNVVHCRLIGFGVSDYRAFLGDVADMLRPGGVYLSIETEMQVYDENFEPITAQEEDDPGFSYMQKLIFLGYCAMKDHNPDGLGSGVQIPKWLKTMDCWEEYGHKKIFTPVGPWEENLDKKRGYIAELCREDAYGLMKSLRPLLLSHGHPEELLDRLARGVKEELFGLKRKLYVTFHCAWAVKKRESEESRRRTSLGTL